MCKNFVIDSITLVSVGSCCGNSGWRGGSDMEELSTAPFEASSPSYFIGVP
jgi:hypothetical protein